MYDGTTMKYISFFFAVFLLAGANSCHYNPVIVHCDTCGLNQDSLQKIKDSLAHAFTWTEYVNKLYGEANLTGCWVFSDTDIYIVGNSLWHYDGKSFAMVPAFDRTYNNVTMNTALNGSNIFAFN